MADISSTQSNNSPEAVKNYSEGWDRIFGNRKQKADTADSAGSSQEPPVVTGTEDPK